MQDLVNAHARKLALPPGLDIGASELAGLGQLLDWGTSGRLHYHSFLDQIARHASGTTSSSDGRGDPYSEERRSWARDEDVEFDRSRSWNGRGRNSGRSEGGKTRRAGETEEEATLGPELVVSFPELGALFNRHGVRTMQCSTAQCSAV